MDLLGIWSYFWLDFFFLFCFFFCLSYNLLLLISFVCLKLSFNHFGEKIIFKLLISIFLSVKIQGILYLLNFSISIDLRGFKIIINDIYWFLWNILIGIDNYSPIAIFQHIFIEFGLIAERKPIFVILFELEPSEI